MEVDKAEGVDAKLTELKKPKKRKKTRSKKWLLAKGEDTKNPITSVVGAIASADQEMIVIAPSSNGDVPDVTASRDICSPAATADKKMMVLTPAVTADGNSLISSTNPPDKTVSHEILSPAAIVDKQMKVLSPAPVQECVVMETDKDEVAAKLTKSQKNNRKRKLKIERNKNLESSDKREGTKNPGSLSAIASVDPKMLVLSDEKSSIPSTIATDQLAPGDTLSTKVHEPVSGETGLGKTVTDSAPSKKRKRNQTAKNTVAGDVLSAKADEVVSGETIEGKTVTDETTPKKKKKKRNKKKKKVAGDILSAKVDEIVSGETVPDKALTDNTTPEEKKMKIAADVLSTEVHEVVSGDTGLGKTVTDSTPSKKRKRNQKAKKAAAGDVLSAKVDEIVSVETVSAKTVTDDATPKKTKKKRNKKKKKVAVDILSAEVDEIASGEMVPDKAVTDNTTPEEKKMKVAGDVLSTEVHEVVSGETVPGKTATINTTPTKKKRNKKKRKLKTVAGDVLSTCKNVQGKGNAIEGLSVTDMTELIIGEMVSGKTALPDVKMVSQEEHTEAANGKTGPSATPNLNVNGAVNSSLTIGEILTPQNLQNLKADSGEMGSGTNAADTTTSKKRKRAKNKKKSQDKVNGIDGLNTTKVLDTKVISKTELSDITNHHVDGKKSPEVAKSEINASNRKKQKVDVNPSENEEITQATPGKKLIIFDVNGMLADIVFPRPKDVEADKYSRGKAVFKRPYLDDFLSFCFENFNVGIWSSRMKKNLDPVVDCLFGDLKKKLLFIWDASHCRNSGMRTLEDRYKCIVFKELRKIWEKDCHSWVKGTFNESNTLLLDDSPYKALLNPKHTGIFPTSYKYTDTNDDYLGPTGALRAYLEGYAAADDGRTYIEQNPFGEGPIDETNRDWKYYSRVLKGQS